MSKKAYNEIEVQDNMVVRDETEETSAKDREPLKPIVAAQAPKKKGLIGRLITGLAGPEGLAGVGTYVNEEIIIPAIKGIIVDGVTSGINRIMYGDKGGYRGGTGYGGGYRPTTNYSNRYQPQSSYRDREPEPRRATVQSGHVEEFLIENRHDAAHVLTVLSENADRYGSVSIADYYDLISAPTQFTDNNRGWSFRDIQAATIVPVAGGFIIRFPQPVVL